MSANLKILYIGDDPLLARSAKKDLERSGHEVEVATDAGTGLDRVTAGVIDVVALDHDLSGQDGLETLAAIRAVSAAPPVVCVTATKEASIAVAALKAGAADCVVKDVGGEFFSLLANAIEQAHGAARLRLAREQAELDVRVARDRFQALAMERDLLLREANHRVGNSLQIVASMLRFQSSAADSEDARIALETARQRVVAVAQVHRRLCGSNGVGSVALDGYLRALADDLRQFSGPEAMVLQTEPIDVDPDRAVAAGVLVTEFVLNALKHAYPARTGPIRIRLVRGQGGLLHLSVEDDGIGANGGSLSKEGLGGTIMRAMAEKLGASVHYDGGHSGARVTFDFAAGLDHENAGSPAVGPPSAVSG